jgi:Tfp pilus assembly protein PilN
VISNLNLASRPFRNRALPWTIISLVALVSLASLVWVAGATNEANAKANAVERELASLRVEAGNLQGQAEEVKSALTPEQQQALDAAHTLVDRKRFSWSRLFADLETALPANVRVTRIGVRDVALRGDQTYAELDIAVFSTQPAQVTDMIAEMDRNGVFQAQPVSQTFQKGRTETGTEWLLNVLYTPRNGAPATPPARNANTVAEVSSDAKSASGGLR